MKRTKQTKRHQNSKEELLLFADNMMVYNQNFKESTENKNKNKNT